MCWADAPWRSCTTAPACCATWREAVKVSGDKPVLIDSYLQDAIEVDVDAIADGEPGATSPASWSISRRRASIRATPPARLPPYSLPEAVIEDIRAQTETLGLALGVVGLMNVQFAVKDKHGLHPRGQPARLAHGSLRGQGDRRAHRQDRGTAHGGRAARALPPRRARRAGMSRSRKRSSPLPASPTSTPSSGRR